MSTSLDWEAATTLNININPLPQIISHINCDLQEQGAIFRLESGHAFDRIYFAPASTLWLPEGGEYSISVSAEFQSYLKSKFQQSGYSIQFNQTASYFWVIDLDRGEPNET